MTARNAYLTTITSLAVRNDATVRLDEVTGPFDAETKRRLADRLAAMDPWHRYGFSSERLVRFLSAPAPDARRLLMIDGERHAGVAVVRTGWLAGSYLNFLAVMPEDQGRGIGEAFLAWLAEEGHRLGERNQFVAASAFNAAALAFYERHGFTPVAELPGLISDEETEILLRRRLA
ncbi:MAG: GNAT family N-acetyltransferase [Hyphomicrobiaceae bacterium]|nr:GNAT family N-acetyltransferase [Hyphomicrobiaceae bacterium]